MAIRKLTPELHPKVWGSPLTQPWLANPEGHGIGEIWFSAPESMPVLVKLLFTSDRLSVQVHPDDAYAIAHGEVRGKTEMWHVLRAEPGATIALGLRVTTSGEALRAAAVSGDIVDLLRWIPAQEGDTFFVPAGTIHAIGSGLALIEIQQLSDATYRLFDYEREPPRPLHLDDSLAVARLVPSDGRRDSTPLSPHRELLAECEHFRTERLRVRGVVDLEAIGEPAIYIALAGEGRIAGESFQAGEAWLAPAGTPAFSIDSPEATFVVAGTGKSSL